MISTIHSAGLQRSDPSQVDLQQRPETTNIQQVLESSLIVSVADLNNLLLIIPTSNTSEVRAESIKRMSDEDTSVSGSHSGTGHSEPMRPRTQKSPDT